MLGDYRLFVTQLVTLWAVLDPVGYLPLFLSATTGLDETGRRRAARLGVAVAFAFGILVGFSLIGGVLLHAMGISLLSFQIAGGAIIFLFALSMVLGDAKASEGPSSPGADATAVAIHPLATPSIAGPGAMLTMVLLMGRWCGEASGPGPGGPPGAGPLRFRACRSSTTPPAATTSRRPATGSGTGASTRRG